MVGTIHHLQFRSSYSSYLRHCTIKDAVAPTKSVSCFCVAWLQLLWAMSMQQQLIEVGICSFGPYFQWEHGFSSSGVLTLRQFHHLSAMMQSQSFGSVLAPAYSYDMHIKIHRGCVACICQMHTLNFWGCEGCESRSGIECN